MLKTTMQGKRGVLERMSENTQIARAGNALPQSLPKQPTPTSLNQYGNDSTQIAYVQNYDATVNQTVVILPNNSITGVPSIPQDITFNYDCFNFFVIGIEQYTEPSFIVPKNRALTESTSQEVKDQLASLTPEAVATIKTFPALFCSENHHYAKTDPDHIAYYGYVKDIKVQDNGIKVYYQILNSLPQQVLIDYSEDLCIGGARSFTELTRTHWAIKRINLVEVLEKAGYKVFKL